MIEWSRHCGFEPAKHHRLLIEKLEAVARGEIKRLAIFLPPGSAKSTYASVLFPAWFLIQKPNASLIMASHTADLAEHFGRRVRNLIDQNQSVLGYSLRKDSRAVGGWETDKGAEYKAAGVGGSITGRRADLAVIDDPVKSKEDADSQTVRDKQWEWWLFDLKTRLKPGAPVVLIQTRWHENDLGGRVLDPEYLENSEWEVVSIPMVAESEDDPLGRPIGARLWDDYFTEDQVETARRKSRLWSALYQQRPVPEEGDYFKKDWLVGYMPEELPVQLQCYSASDHAVGLKQENDRTCCLTVGVDMHGVIWVLPDIYWKKAPSDQVVDAMIDMAERRQPITWWAESGHISKAIGPFLETKKHERGVYFYIEESTPSKDKPTRAQSIRGRMAGKMVRFPKFASWWTEAEEELLTFPAGKHDDFVDALAHIGLGLNRLRGKAPKKPKKEVKPLSWEWLRDTCRRQQLKEKISNDDR